MSSSIHIHPSSGLDQLGLGINALISSNGKLLESGEFSDLTILCGPQRFKVHQFILCPRSPFFATALQGSFLEGTTKTIELPEDDPATVHRMLNYLYTLEYSIQEPSSDTNVQSGDGHDQWKSSLLGHCAVYILADKLDIPDLKQYSLGLFKVTVAQNNLWNLESFLEIAKSSLSMLPTSDSGLVPELLHLCVEQIHEHPETFVLKDQDVGVTTGSKIARSEEDDHSVHDHWQDMLKENPLFTVALSRKLVQRSKDSYGNLEKQYKALKAAQGSVLAAREPIAPATSLRLFGTPLNVASNNGRPNDAFLR